jgi:hypothetical protein
MVDLHDSEKLWVNEMETCQYTFVLKTVLSEK